MIKKTVAGLFLAFAFAAFGSQVSACDQNAESDSASAQHLAYLAYLQELEALNEEASDSADHQISYYPPWFFSASTCDESND